ncbi:3-(methylthio)propionyl-CoA ligase [Minwuia sp.]|uniref:3-(methylthio)propionyl-CoA ligase n=1 Tax=Minwuia sp. TaxID=2493630 RepID=UPI003A8C9EAD
MQGLMQNKPLLIHTLIDYAAQYHGRTEIVTRSVEGPVHRYTYRDAAARSKQLANALTRLGVELGDRIGTLAWNTYRHFECYYGVSGLGAVLHTINPRLFPEQIVYIANHAEDRIIFTDLTFVPLLEKIQDELKSVEHIVIMTDAANMPETSLKNVICYEDMLAAESTEFDWPQFDEMTASSLCYTSGTTGNPKGVLYAHRTTVLHSFAACMGDCLGLSSKDTVLPVVPMFHANAWGLAYAAPMCGAKMVLPGKDLDGKSVYDLLNDEEVTMSAGVPTVWLMLLNYMEENGLKLPHMNRTVIGGSAAPASMIRKFEQEYDAAVIHAWGMTEMSPLGTTGVMTRELEKKPFEEQLEYKAKQGRVIYGVDLKITDDENKELPRDGVAFGNLKTRGYWITAGYFKGDGGKILDDGNWFDTGDVATLDEDGFMTITDRAKDVIKSGGEWISSIDLENAAMAHPDVAEAAVIGIYHPKWDERPLLCIIRKKGKDPSKESIMKALEGQIAKWWMPDDIAFVDEIPHTATGKIQKVTLREQFKDYKLPTA